MARQTTQKTKTCSHIAFFKSLLVISVSLLGSACGHLVTPDAEAVQPAQRTARLEELHRVHAVQEKKETVQTIQRWVVASIYRVDEDPLDTIARDIIHHAEQQRIDPFLVAAVIAVESYYHPEVISYAGAVGLMQVLPYVGRDVAHRNQISWDTWQTLQNPRANIAIGTTYLSELIEMFGGDVRLALAAYNMGPTLLKQRLKRGFIPNGPYVSKVMSTYRDIRSNQAGRQHFAFLTHS